MPVPASPASWSWVSFWLCRSVLTNSPTAADVSSLFLFMLPSGNISNFLARVNGEYYRAGIRYFMRSKVMIIGYLKFASVDCLEKLTEILRENDIKSVTIVRMEDPCGDGLEIVTKKTLQASSLKSTIRTMCYSSVLRPCFGWPRRQIQLSCCLNQVSLVRLFCLQLPVAHSCCP